MVDRRQTRWRIRQLRQVKTWQLLLLLVVCGFISATFLRLNNVGMVERRDAVEAADKSGDTVAVERRLYDLQRYVSVHMNADPGRIALEQSYKKAYEQRLKEFETEIAGQSSNDVVAKVRQACDARAQQGGYGHFSTAADPRYVACVNEEWSKYPAAQASNYSFVAPSTAPYYHSFISPLWSSDFAGWSLVVTALVGLILVARGLMLLGLRWLLKRRYRPL